MQAQSAVTLVDPASTTASLLRYAPRATSRSAASFTVAQRAARYGLTVLAVVAMSALFATQVAATLR